jgi:N6-L-threonylcarbamoyladenine synthase
MASREHARFIGPLCDRVLQGAGVAPDDIDVVAVARGPGLLGSLLVGVAFAKAFALGCGAIFLGVNHLHAHLFAAGLEQELIFPALGLLVSGGHTNLYRMEGPDALTLLGTTLDDAAGEAFDKAGKMLGLPYPAGRHIDELAGRGRAKPATFPRPYLDTDSLNFSFSGIKTAMATYLSSHPGPGANWSAAETRPLAPEGEAGADLADLCASYRLAIVETLAAKTGKALAKESMRDVRGLVLAGGVASNSLLRKAMAELAEERELCFFVPSADLCTDNGAMIGYLGWLLALRGYRHALDMEAVPRGKKIPEDMRREPQCSGTAHAPEADDCLTEKQAHPIFA